jgi:hypothetical protein
MNKKVVMRYCKSAMYQGLSLILSLDEHNPQQHSTIRVAIHILQIRKTRLKEDK